MNILYLQKESRRRIIIRFFIFRILKEKKISSNSLIKSSKTSTDVFLRKKRFAQSNTFSFLIKCYLIVLNISLEWCHVCNFFNMLQIKRRTIILSIKFRVLWYSKKYCNLILVISYILCFL